MADNGTRHRSGWLKQSNKSHKQSKRSKRSVDRSNGGRISRAMSVASKGRSVGGRSLATIGREARANQALLIRRNKRQALLNARRRGGATVAGIVDGAPRVVGIIYLCEQARMPALVEADEEEMVAHFRSCTKMFPKEKFRATFLVAGRNNLSVLDVTKVADILCFVLPLCVGENEVEIKAGKEGVLERYFGNAVDEQGRQFLSIAKAEGLPSVIGIVQNLEETPAKYHSTLKKQAARFFEDEFGENVKCIVDEPPKSSKMDMGQDEQMDEEVKMSINQVHFLRAIMDTKLKMVTWRAERTYMLADEAHFAPEEPTSSDGNGTLMFTGYLRGRPLNVHQLVHIPGHGNFRIKQIDSVPDPNSLRTRRKGEEEPQRKVLVVAEESLKPSMQEEATPDLLAGEQTWPTNEEMNDVPEEQSEEISKMEKKKKKLLKETNDIQASWLMGLSDDEEDEEEDEQDALEKDDDDDLMDEGQHDKATLEEWKARQRDDVEFPDEVDTPPDIPARERFAKYRGLKSFRTSMWHPKESLPREYSRIYQFANPVAIQNEVLEEGAALERKYLDQVVYNNNNSNTSEMETDQDNNVVVDKYVVNPGQYVTLHVENVPKTLLADIAKAEVPLILGALLTHEQKLTVINTSIRKASSYEDPVKAKDVVLMSCGIWRRLVRPIYSENTVNCDKHKSERFLHDGRWSVATVYGPVTFGTNVPVLMLNPKTHELVANGSVMDMNPDRIVLKKVVLTGHPIRVKKSWAVVRYMFFHPDDIRWFKPVDLWTKYGMSGRILEPLGTHGLFKCSFSKPIKNHDTVCMSLYKRVYPKPVNEFKDEMSS